MFLALETAVIMEVTVKSGQTSEYLKNQDRPLLEYISEYVHNSHDNRRLTETMVYNEEDKG